MSARAQFHDPTCLLRFLQGGFDLLLRVSRPHSSERYNKWRGSARSSAKSFAWSEAAACDPISGRSANRSMIPSAVASEVADALRSFLATGFGPSNPELAGVIDDFLAEPENLVKGPYLSIALRYRHAPEGGEPFPDVPLGYTPYRHQRTAFSRLAADAGRSTVIATGTGSGKTECFLLPILDYCRR